jgi:hypothetical protein
MVRALYRQIKRFLAWMNGGGYSGKEAENYRREFENRHGRGMDGYS